MFAWPVWALDEDMLTMRPHFAASMFRHDDLRDDESAFDVDTVDLVPQLLGHRHERRGVGDARVVDQEP